MNIKSFDKLINKAERLLDRMAESSIYESSVYLKIYLNLLSSYGWTEIDFNKEYLRRIDLEWDRIINPLNFLN